MSPLDPNRFKEGQRQNWDGVAAGWQRLWKTIEVGAEKLSKRLIELAEVMY
jgi:hypothetical protein